MDRVEQEGTSNMSLEAELLEAFEEHSSGAIRKLLAAGVSPIEPIKGKPIDSLIETYLRSPRLPECLQVLLDAGATTGSPLLEAILLDDAARLSRLLAETSDSLRMKLSPLCAFTSCRGVSPLHICAEFNSIRCLRLLLENGAGVNAPADLDAEGIGGQTPIFHAVNSIFNYCRPAMEILAGAGADLNVQVKALLWGESMSWETVVFDVTPVSYAQCGLYRQFHRREEHIYSNIEFLYSKRYAANPPIRSVPNKYLAPS